jgi:hypothetical protein
MRTVVKLAVGTLILAMATLPAQAQTRESGDDGSRGGTSEVADPLGAFTPRVRGAKAVRNYVPDPFVYYLATTSGAQHGSYNPVAAPDCYYEYVFDEGTYYGVSTMQEVFSKSYNNPDFAFDVEIPVTSPRCATAEYVKIVWSAQVHVPNAGAGPQGVGLVCEIEQTNYSSGITYRVPCPGTHVFFPFIGRNDEDFTGSQILGSFHATILVPSHVHNFKTTASDITVRIGFYHNLSGGAYTIIANQVMSVATGSAPSF